MSETVRSEHLGALVVTMPASMLGQEIEVVAAHEPTGHQRPHVAVVDRPVAEGGRVPSLVFPKLPEGSYWLAPRDTDDVHLTVEVHGGEVTTAAWPCC